MLAAAIQMSSGPDRAANEARALALCEEAADRGATFIGLPEMWEHIGPLAQKDFAGMLDGASAQPAASAAVRPSAAASLDQLGVLRAFAIERRVWLLAGSIAERAPEGRIYNTSVLLGPDGGVLARYRKLHLFDVDIPDGATYRESASVAPGSEPPPSIAIDGLRFGLSVCYDLRFPELYRSLAADVLCVPSAFTFYTGKAHWDVLLRARAIENQAYVLAPAQAGRIGPLSENRVAYGHACIVDPWGEVLATCGGEGEGIALAEIDPVRLAQVRRDLPALRHRRPDVLR